MLQKDKKILFPNNLDQNADMEVIGQAQREKDEVINSQSKTLFTKLMGLFQPQVPTYANEDTDTQDEDSEEFQAKIRMRMNRLIEQANAPMASQGLNNPVEEGQSFSNKPLEVYDLPVPQNSLNKVESLDSLKIDVSRQSIEENNQGEIKKDELSTLLEEKEIAHDSQVHTKENDEDKLYKAEKDEEPIIKIDNGSHAKAYVAFKSLRNFTSEKLAALDAQENDSDNEENILLRRG